ncbi:MAG TPA: sigma-70 family RNA polymerase sigma factor, partial [Lachnospiraceae bacterium]|nr:sigma-70 family RNA polymerase sigma factor [Lachnospiraceae bacterium]
CVARIRSGDRNGLREIYEEYLPYIYTVVYGILQNKENAEDVTSDFFIRFWNSASQYKGGNGHKGYLATIARNMAIDFLRKRKKEVLMDDFSEAGTDGGGTVGYANDTTDSAGDQRSALGKAVASAGEQHSLENEVLSDISLKEALDKLKPEEKKIIDMKILGEMTFKEIAKVLGIPMGTVTWRYQEGIKRLRRYGYE